MFGNPESCFEALTDPRRENKNKIHKLSDIVFLVLAAVISGIEDWVGMEVWATTKEEWLRKYIKLANGVPSHDTLRAVMSRIKPEEFNIAFTKWVQTELPTLVGCRCRHRRQDAARIAQRARHGTYDECLCGQSACGSDSASLRR